VSLRLQINLIIAVLMSLFIGTVVYQQVQDTRSSVREEIEGSNQVAAQLFTRVSWVYEVSGLRGMLSFLDQLGRVRANDVFLYDPAGTLVYSSPPSTYKSGRDAPRWFARLVSPPPQREEIRIGDGRLVVQANSSRAVLDGWDTLSRLLWIGAIALAVVNAVAFWLTGRVLQPLQTVIKGLKRMEQGDYQARLPIADRQGGPADEPGLQPHRAGGRGQRRSPEARQRGATAAAGESRTDADDPGPYRGGAAQHRARAARRARTIHHRDQEHRPVDPAARPTATMSA
jgi:membrane protein implicated in regulation of membrane protease activity